MDSIKSFLFDNILWWIAIPVLLSIVFLIKHYWIGYPDDNPVEELVEKVIEDQTKVDVDLTPGSSENKD